MPALPRAAAAVRAASLCGTLSPGAAAWKRSWGAAARPLHATPSARGFLDRVLGTARGAEPEGPADDVAAVAAGVTSLVSVARPYPGEPLREELAATDEVRAQINVIDRQLSALDELSYEAIDLRQKRRDLLLPFRQRLEAEDAKLWKTEEHRIERAKNPSVPRIIYFWRHGPMGKIFINDTQFLDYKQFHHQTSLKSYQKIIKLRRDHWEPLLAVTGLPYAADVKRVIERSLCPEKQVKQREGRRKLMENTGTRVTPGPKPPKAMIRATETLEFSKKAVTRLARALRELQEDMGDIHAAGVKIWWSREADKRILLRRGTDTRADIAAPGEWPEWIEHRMLETDRTNQHILNIHEDITYEIEARRRYRWRQPMVAPGEPFYPKRAPGRAAWLIAECKRVGKRVKG